MIAECGGRTPAHEKALQWLEYGAVVIGLKTSPGLRAAITEAHELADVVVDEAGELLIAEVPLDLPVAR